MKTQSKRLAHRAAASIAALSMITSAVSCSKSDSSQTNLKIAVLGQSQVSFWDDFEKGAQDAGRELGYEIVYVEGTDDNDVETQKTFLSSIKASEYAAVVIAPNDTQELNDSIKTLKSNGIPIIEINNTTDEETFDSHIGSSNTEAGKVAARKIAETLTSKYGNTISGRGKFAIIYSSAEATQSRAEGFKSEIISRICNEINNAKQSTNSLSIQKNPTVSTDDSFTEEKIIENVMREYFIETQECNSESDAHDLTNSILTKYSDEIGVLVGTNTNTTLGICRAVEDLNLQDKVIVIGFNADIKELNYIENGTLEGTILQNPYIMGYLGIRYATYAINDKKPPSFVDTGVTYIDNSSLHNNEYVKLITSLTTNEEE